MTDAAGGWRVDLVDDVEIGGWVPVPADMSDADAMRWRTDQAAQLLERMEGRTWDGERIAAADLEPLLDAALETRATREGLAMLQLWPVRAPVAVMCHVNLIPSAELPRWADADEAVVRPVDAAHVGPGVQVSVRYLEQVGDSQVELMSYHLVFDDGETALMLSLEGSFPTLIAAALPAFEDLAGVIRVHRPDGSTFASVAPSGVVTDSEWDLEPTP